jgi:hypothetical protein
MSWRAYVNVVRMVIKDFSNRKLIEFQIDDDVFRGVPNIPVEQFVKLAAGFSNEDTPLEEQVSLFHAMFRTLLTDESAELFITRMGDKENPISIVQVQDIMMWLMEQYGMRPTQQSLASLPGLENLGDGTSSTDAAPATELTYTNSPQLVSST